MNLEQYLVGLVHFIENTGSNDGEVTLQEIRTYFSKTIKCDLEKIRNNNREIMATVEAVEDLAEDGKSCLIECELPGAQGVGNVVSIFSIIDVVQRIKAHYSLDDASIKLVFWEN